MYAKPFTKVLGLVVCQVTSKILGIGPSEKKWKEYKHVQCGHMSCLQSDSYKNQAILYGVANLHKNSIMGTGCVYNWTNIMVDMSIDKILHNDREPFHDRIFNVWVKDWYSDTLRTRCKENDQRLLQKYRNIRLLDDDENQTYTTDPENLEFKGPTRRNNQYCVVGQPLA